MPKFHEKSKNHGFKAQIFTFLKFWHFLTSQKRDPMDIEWTDDDMDSSDGDAPANAEN